MKNFVSKNCLKKQAPHLRFSPNEIVTAKQEVENESLQKLCYDMYQMYIEQNFEIEAEHQYDIDNIYLSLAETMKMKWSLLNSFPKTRTNNSQKKNLKSSSV